MRIAEANERDVEQFVRNEQDRTFFLDRLRHPGFRGGRVFLAIEGNRAVGYVYLRLETAEEFKLRFFLRRAPLLEKLRVDKDQQGRGVGRLLVGMAEATAWAHRRRRIALGVVVENPEPIGFYQRLGYAEWRHGLIKAYKNGPKSEIELCRVFVKKLTPPTS
ncbi:GNAT family N-acetyltransferase [Actinoplanes bogorensis]|uniref:GNAT family N-acetyltransferase n=1 Tax=Paractinoplanes bogorensis TaxID=1610840 RepID=A0ABS5YGI0_9ACTN|nr:GNAT family N-acetyltransferase [Actinoplanes bogorensis]MBU2662446.1 GNAT family N-acetyltransferase [Actinoplanes bogorensis]